MFILLVSYTKVGVGLPENWILATSLSMSSSKIIEDYLIFAFYGDERKGHGMLTGPVHPVLFSIFL